MEEPLILSGFWRRFCAAVYDLLLASAVCVLAAAIGFVCRTSCFAYSLAGYQQ